MPPGGLLRRRSRERRAAVEFGEAACQALAVGIGEGGGAGARHRVGGKGDGNLPVERGTDDAGRDRLVVRRAALVGLTVALDQGGGFGDLEGETGGELRRRQRLRPASRRSRR